MITIDTMDEIFTVAQQDIQQIIGAVQREFNSPETERETVKMWLELPLMLREAITAKNPKLAKNLDAKARKLRGGK